MMLLHHWTFMCFDDLWNGKNCEALLLIVKQINACSYILLPSVWDRVIDKFILQ